MNKSTNTCMITGVVTNNKWRNYVVHPAVIKHVKKMPRGYGNTLKDNLIHVWAKFKSGVHKEMTTEEYGNYIYEFFGEESESNDKD